MISTKAHYASELRKLADLIEQSGVLGLVVALHVPGKLPGQSAAATITYADQRHDALAILGEVEALKLELAAEVSFEKTAETAKTHQVPQPWGAAGMN